MRKYEIECLREKLYKELDKDSPDKKAILTISQDLDNLIVEYTKNYINEPDKGLGCQDNSLLMIDEPECTSD